MANAINPRHPTVYPVFTAQEAERIVERRKKKRELLGENQTSSLHDFVLDKEREKIARNEPLQREEKAALADWKSCLERSKEAIEQHLDKRLSHLFLQAILCYNTHYVFEKGPTMHQGLGAHTLKYGEGSIKMDAAHSPTLPCIYATSPTTGEKFVYLYRSGAYDEGNATIDLMTEINKADLVIDETFHLRTETIDLLNRTARGELTPDQVVKKFAKKMNVTIQDAVDTGGAKKVKDVLQVYLNKSATLIFDAQDPDQLDQWLNLQMENPLLDDVTEVIDKIEQEEEVSPTKIRELIKRKVHDLPAIIYQERHLNRNERKAPCHFYDLYYLQLLKNFKGENLKELEKSLGINFKEIKKAVASYTYTQGTKALLAKHQEKISLIQEELQPFLNILNNKQAIAPLTGLSPQKKVSLRPGIYKLRYQMIREDQAVQSKLKAKIETIFNELKGDKAARHLLSFFHFALLNHSDVNPQIRKIFCKLLNISGFTVTRHVREIKAHQDVALLLDKWEREIEACVSEARTNSGNRQVVGRKIRTVLDQLLSDTVNPEVTQNLFYKRILEELEQPAQKQFVEQLIGTSEVQVDAFIASQDRGSYKAEETVNANLTKISEIMTLASQEIKALQEKTYQFRSDLLAELRRSHAMTQKGVRDLHAEKFSYICAGAFSELETGIRYVDDTLVHNFSTLFGVDERLFRPGHFAEV